MIIKHKRRTKLNEVLAEIDERMLPNGKRKVFSIKFCEKNGKLTYLPYCIAVGLKFNMMATDMKAVQPTNADGEPLANAHIYPVWIHSIWEFNGQKT